MAKKLFLAAAMLCASAPARSSAQTSCSGIATTYNAVLDQVRNEFCGAKIADPNNQSDLKQLSGAFQDTAWTCTGYNAYTVRHGDDPVDLGSTFQVGSFMTDFSNETYSMTIGVDTTVLTPTQTGLTANGNGVEYVIRLLTQPDDSTGLIMETAVNPDRNFNEWPAISDPTRNAWTYWVCSRNGN